MEFKTIEVKNFRPYRSVTVDLTNRDGHIHIIEGPQGAGKTSLQKAIKWALYHRSSGRTSDYTQNWNATAKELAKQENATSEEHKLRVTIKFEESGRSYELTRYGTSYRFQQEEIETRVELVEDGEETYTGVEAENIVSEFLPPDLSRFFLLDGEEIQELIEDETGRKAKEDIETVLKHQAIIEGENHLKTNLLKEYRKKRSSLQDEKEKRDELLDRITNYEEKIESEESKIQSSREELEELRENISETEDALREYDEELSDKIERKDQEIKSKTQKKTRLVEELKEEWDSAPYTIVAPEIEDATATLKQRLDKIEDQLKKERRQYFLQEFRSIAEDEECPVCGSRDGHLIEDHTSNQEISTEEDDLNRQRIEIEDKVQSLNAISTSGTSPVVLKNKIDTLSSEIDSLEEDKSNLQQEFGGYISDSEKNDLQSDLDAMEDREDELVSQIRTARENISELEDKIGELRRERKQKAGKSDVDEVDEKIELVEHIIDQLQEIRSKHIEKKRELIRKEMNRVFDVVARSEFISQRYDSITFKGGMEEDDLFVLQLVKENGEPKDMENHPPSAGEAQLTALSFIFGLNAFAKYSTTVVFDTVAGRLDLTNSRAQGQFFANLSEPIILLVTDAEYRDMEQEIEGSVGDHYRIVPTEDTNSQLMEVEK